MWSYWPPTLPHTVLVTHTPKVVQRCWICDWCPTLCHNCNSSNWKWQMYRIWSKTIFQKAIPLAWWKVLGLWRLVPCMNSFVNLPLLFRPFLSVLNVTPTSSIVFKFYLFIWANSYFHFFIWANSYFIYLHLDAVAKRTPIVKSLDSPDLNFSPPISHLICWQRAGVRGGDEISLTELRYPKTSLLLNMLMEPRYLAKF